MKKMKLLCAALTVIMLLTACSGSTSSAAEKVIGTTDKVVAADTLKPLAKADKEKLGYQLDMPEKGEEICVLTTNYGTIRMRFFPDAAPKAVYSFKSLALSGYYDGVTFHRVIDDFMIQGGDPLGNGTGGESIWGENYDDEFHENLVNITGAVSCANSGANTNGSQFFINCTEPGKIDWDTYDQYYQVYKSAPEKFTSMYGGTLDMDKVTDAYKELYDTNATHTLTVHIPPQVPDTPCSHRYLTAWTWCAASWALRPTRTISRLKTSPFSPQKSYPTNKSLKQI